MGNGHYAVVELEDGSYAASMRFAVSVRQPRKKGLWAQSAADPSRSAQGESYSSKNPAHTVMDGGKVRRLRKQRAMLYCTRDAKPARKRFAESRDGGPTHGLSNKE